MYAQAVNNRALRIIVLRAFAIALQLGFIKLYTHYLDIKELGVYFYVSTLSYSLNALIFVPIDYYFQRTISPDSSVTIPLGLIIELGAMAVLTALLLQILLGAGLLINGQSSLYQICVAYFLALFLFLDTSFRNILNNRGHGVFVVGMLSAEAAMKLLFFFIMKSWMASAVLALLVSWVAALLVEFVIVMAFVLIVEPIELTRPKDIQLYRIFSFCLPISFSAFSNWVQLQGYRLVYVWLGQSEVAGIYAALSNIGQVSMAAIAAIFTQLFQPKLYITNGKFIKKFLFAGLSLIITAVIAYVVIGREIISIATKKEYANFYRLAIMGIVVEGGNLLIGGMTTYASIKEKTFFLYTSNLSSVMVCMTILAMALMAAPQNPYLIGLALVLSQAIACAYLFFYVIRRGENIRGFQSA